ncbi:MAG3720 family protein [Mycoplasmopsis columbina]|uniref:MAG3720 family protein n=1 Tax=Mycoplasmopsis columbina TaxID=114881 RepID=UPI0004A774B8|nr:hypothetical protein [Mycoplasmopsis columbina]VEU76947.1 Uncharacterised protein [Mycoplasmopsis columbina]
MNKFYVNYFLNENAIKINILQETNKKSAIIYKKIFSPLLFDQTLEDVVLNTKKILKNLRLNKHDQLFYTLIVDENFDKYLQLKHNQAEILVKSNLVSKQHLNELNQQLKKARKNEQLVILNQEKIQYLIENELNEIKTYNTFPINKVAKKVILEQTLLTTQNESELNYLVNFFQKNKIVFNQILTNSQCLVHAQPDVKKHFKTLINFDWNKLNLSLLVNNKVVSFKKYNCDFKDLIKGELKKIINLSDSTLDLLLNGVIKNYPNYKLNQNTLTNHQKLTFNFVESMLEKIVEIIYNFWKDNNQLGNIILINETLGGALESKLNEYDTDVVTTLKDLEISSEIFGVINLINGQYVQSDDQNKTVNNITLPNTKNIFDKLFGWLNISNLKLNK